MDQEFFHWILQVHLKIRGIEASIPSPMRNTGCRCHFCHRLLQNSVVFQIQNFLSPVVIPARSSMQVFTLIFNSTAAATTVTHGEPHATSLESRFRLHTNISRFDIPLHLFDGNLRVSWQLIVLRYGIRKGHGLRKRACKLRNCVSVRVNCATAQGSV